MNTGNDPVWYIFFPAETPVYNADGRMKHVAQVPDDHRSFLGRVLVKPADYAVCLKNHLTCWMRTIAAPDGYRAVIAACDFRSLIPVPIGEIPCRPAF